MSFLPTELSFSALRARHAAVLFDAYGVLLDANGALPGAIEALTAMRAEGQPFLVVTNDASSQAASAAQRYARLGLPLGPEHILSSGTLIGAALQRHGMVGRRVVVLGPPDAQRWVTEIGATVVEPSLEHPADAVVIADEGGYGILDTLDETVSMLVGAWRAGARPPLLLANPDLVYPSGGGRFGVTAGSIALIVERALELLLGPGAPTFEPLGKPAVGHFEAAMTRLGTRDVVMIGDQLRTDIAGAAAAGIASALVLTGVTDREAVLKVGPVRPTYLLRDLCD